MNRNKLIYSIKSGVLFASFSCSATLQEKEEATDHFGTQIVYVSDSLNNQKNLLKKYIFQKKKKKKKKKKKANKQKELYKDKRKRIKSRRV